MPKRGQKSVGSGNRLPEKARQIKEVSKMPFTNNQYELYIISSKHLKDRIYENPDNLLLVVNDYFNWCKDKKESLTITGLALYSGFSDKQVMYSYAKRNDYEFLKSALLSIEQKYEKGLETSAVIGSIFALKNMEWKDKTETTLSYNDIQLNMAIDSEDQIPAISQNTIERPEQYESLDPTLTPIKLINNDNENNENLI